MLKPFALVASMLLAFGAAAALPAQGSLTVIPNTGCSDGSPIGIELNSVDGQLPSIGNLTFALQHTCPVDADAAVFTGGACIVGPGINWDLTSTCVGGWQNPPTSCGMAWDPLTLGFLGGSPVRQDGKVAVAFPIPQIPGLAGVTFCFQFVCIELGTATPCREISQGLQITFG